MTILPRIRVATEESEDEYFDLDQKEESEMVYRKDLVHRYYFDLSALYTNLPSGSFLSPSACL